MRIAIVNGPNLNLLGEREPAVYGRTTLAELESTVAAYAAERGVETAFFQANGEGAIIDELHRLRRWADGIVINPGAYTHYSYAIRDALASIAVPAIEVHLSDIAKREAFRRISVTADVCVAQIAGLGVASYLRGIDRLIAHAAQTTIADPE
jgi:3-dehydroquinate dehydratase-2